MDSKSRIFLLVFVALAIFVMIAAIYGLWYTKKYKDKINEKKKKNIGKTNLQKLNENSVVSKFQSIGGKELTAIFYKAKNPWGITPAIFQFIRFGGLAISLIFALIMYFVNTNVALFAAGIGILFVWYPMYYYKAIGQEREDEWNKMYEFIWVLKNNAMLYDPAKAFLNTMQYIKEHAPHDHEIIQGFQDFYDNWDENAIPEYINKYYNFSVPKEIYQIIFNMYKSGEFPEEQIDSLRSFIVNHQNLMVEKTLSGVSGKATIYSLPFMMVSVIVALMIPLVFQLIQFM